MNAPDYYFFNCSPFQGRISLHFLVSRKRPLIVSAKPVCLRDQASYFVASADQYSFAAGGSVPPSHLLGRWLSVIGTQTEELRSILKF